MADQTLMTDGQNTQVAEGQTQNTAAGQPGAGQAAPGSTDQPQQQQSAPQGQSADKPADPPAGAPDKYEFTAPEGQSYDSTVIDAYSAAAKELNLPQDAAQKMLDKMAPAIAQRQAQQFEAARTDWANSARGDKEYGGDKLTENLGVAKQALDKFGSPELQKLLNDSGLGNHPEVIRAFYRVGKSMSQDGIVTGKATPAKSATDVLYDKSSSQK